MPACRGRESFASPRPAGPGLPELARIVARHLLGCNALRYLKGAPIFLGSRRSGVAIAMLVVYYGFILLVAFGKEFLSQRIGSGVMTLGIPIGFGVIVFTIVITAIYVRRANSEFDDLTADVTKAVLQ